MVRVQEDISWVYHPEWGVVARAGSNVHSEMFVQNPDLREIAGESYAPPRGYVKVDRRDKQLLYTVYRIPRLDAADALLVDSTIRRGFNIPKAFKSLLVLPTGKDRPLGWFNCQGFATTRYAF